MAEYQIDEEEYRIDELAKAAGTSVRNVRVYRERGLLPRRAARAAPGSTVTPTSRGSA